MTLKDDFWLLTPLDDSRTIFQTPLYFKRASNSKVFLLLLKGAMPKDFVTCLTHFCPALPYIWDHSLNTHAKFSEKTIAS